MFIYFTHYKKCRATSSLMFVPPFYGTTRIWATHTHNDTNTAQYDIKQKQINSILELFV